jgi:hypothetical protein
MALFQRNDNGASGTDKSLGRGRIGIRTMNPVMGIEIIMPATALIENVVLVDRELTIADALAQSHAVVVSIVDQDVVGREVVRLIWIAGIERNDDE